MANRALVREAVAISLLRKLPFQVQNCEPIHKEKYFHCLIMLGAHLYQHRFLLMCLPGETGNALEETAGVAG